MENIVLSKKQVPHSPKQLKTGGNLRNTDLEKVIVIQRFYGCFAWDTRHLTPFSSGLCWHVKHEKTQYYLEHILSVRRRRKPSVCSKVLQNIQNSADKIIFKFFSSLF